ncbi:MAG: pseudouridine synthase [Peptoniphilaceae bacterium]|nr:pseudouridine synthase [Peptoniphilaceae bacterium]MDY6086028.1 pseudouridine synthase [Peptoniphilaceae bacterium]
MRINRFLARSGVASRRKAEDLVREGRVRVNGRVTTDLATQVEACDSVEVDGASIVLPAETVVFRYHKPRGVLCSHEDPHGGALIYDDLPKVPGLFSIGRLDKESEGLILVTNDGAFAQEVAHPSFETEKEYVVLLDRFLMASDRARLLRGVCVDGVCYHCDAIRLHRPTAEEGALLPDWPTPDQKAPLYSVLLHEGKKREIRHLFQSAGYRVDRLVRVRIEDVRLDGLAPGEYARWEGR